MDGACDSTDEKRNIYRVLVRKPEATRPFGRPGRRGEDNIKVLITGSEGIDCIRMSREWEK
jgi:hypothetical protein